MDLLKQLKDKTDSLSTSVTNQGMLSVVSHIQIAEKHYIGGLSGDEYLFNDVVYRTNQAFEGVLKEAYRVINGDDPSKMAPHKIEKYFEDENVLKERVLTLFTNYRKEWRNKSTHDYELFFSEQEAFLAIVNISASGVTEGILYIAPSEQHDHMENVTVTHVIGRKLYKILRIYPSANYE